LAEAGKVGILGFLLAVVAAVDHLRVAMQILVPSQLTLIMTRPELQQVSMVAVPAVLVEHLVLRLVVVVVVVI